jgi:hypothetical protein
MHLVCLYNPLLSFSLLHLMHYIITQYTVECNTFLFWRLLLLLLYLSEYKMGMIILLYNKWDMIRSLQDLLFLLTAKVACR